MRHPIVITLAAGFLLGAPPLSGLAFARQLAPADVNISARGERFVTHIAVSNPYANLRDFRIVAYDEDGQPLQLWADTAQFNLRSGAVRRVMISAPFNGKAQRKIRVCAETPADASHARAEICSKVKGKKL